MNRITRRITGGNVEFVDGKGYASISQKELMELLFKTLADCEDILEKRELNALSAYTELENWLYSDEGKNKPVEIQSAMFWGGLWVVYKQGVIDWDTLRNLYGEFMSKKMNLR